MSDHLQPGNAKPSALFIGAFVPGSQGSRGISEDVALHLGQSGWDVLTTSRSPNKIGRLTDMVATCWRERKNYDVAAIDVYSGLAFRWAEAACAVLHQAGKRYVLMLHGGNLPIFAQQHPKRVSKLLGSATAVTAPSRYLLESMQRYRSDISLIPNALDIAGYPFRAREQAAPQLIWLRAFHETYNPVLAIEVLSRLVRLHPEIQLTMVGPDKGDGSLQRTREAAERLGVSGHLKIAGAIPKAQVATALSTADIFINTTRADNTPVSVLEAMACGLCVISTNVGGIPFLLENERTALLVPTEDADAMASAVHRVLSDPLLAEHLSRQARQATLHFDWPAITQEWDCLLRTVANCHSSKGNDALCRPASFPPGHGAHETLPSANSGSAA